MKTYKVERAYDEEGEPMQVRGAEISNRRLKLSSDVVNLVNIDDVKDIIWCAPDEFRVGSAEFAFKKVEE